MNVRIDGKKWRVIEKYEDEKTETIFLFVERFDESLGRTVSALLVIDLDAATLYQSAIPVDVDYDC